MPKNLLGHDPYDLLIGYTPQLILLLLAYLTKVTHAENNKLLWQNFF